MNHVTIQFAETPQELEGCLIWGVVGVEQFLTERSEQHEAAQEACEEYQNTTRAKLKEAREKREAAYSAWNETKGQELYDTFKECADAYEKLKRDLPKGLQKLEAREATERSRVLKVERCLAFMEATQAQLRMMRLPYDT